MRVRLGFHDSSPAGSLLRGGAALLGFLVLTVRCQGVSQPEPLVRFDSCEDLQAYLEEQILYPGVESAFVDNGLVGCADVPRGEPQPKYTETTTQEVDVDEPDFVKTDGDAIYVLRRGHMVIARARPASSAGVWSDTPVEGVPFTMFLEGDRALLLSRVPASAGGRPSLHAILYDVSDQAQPARLRTIEIDGDYVDGHRVDGTVMLMSSASLAPDVELVDGAFRDEENRTRLRQAGLFRLLPSVRDRIVGLPERVDHAVACENTYGPARTDGRSVMLIHSISLVDETAPLHNTGVIGRWGVVYASRRSLYLASEERQDGGFFTGDFSVTRIHKLRAFTSGRATYEGVGLLEGTLRSDLSLDEHEETDTLRAVITASRDNVEGGSNNQHRLVVLGQQAGELRLVEVGRAEDIGQGGTVQAVRFAGQRAYIVGDPESVSVDTFGVRSGTGDCPLYVVDLTDPLAPIPTGAVGVPGLVTYLHPIDEHHLLAVGLQDEGAGAKTIQLSLVSVERSTAPAVVHQASLPTAAEGTEVFVARHAFTYFAPAKTAAFSTQQVRKADGVATSALQLLRVDPVLGFFDLGIATQPSLALVRGDDILVGDAMCAAVRRSVIIDDAIEGSHVYAISASGMTVAALSQGLPVVAQLSFLDEAEDLCAFDGSPL